MLILLLRNLHSARGLANGTRLIVGVVCRNLNMEEIATGSHPHVDRIAVIPHVTLTPSEDGLRVLSG